MAISLEEAKTILNGAVRSESRDHAFGDREVYWDHPDKAGESVEQGEEVAGGYFGRDCAQVWIGDDVFEGADAYELLKCGQSVQIGRNDMTGPDRYMGA